MIALPAALLAAVVLSRVLGPEGYGVLGLALAIMTLTQWTVAAAFGRAGVAMVGGAGKEWEAAADTLTALHLWCGLGAMVLTVVLAPLAQWFTGMPGLAVLLMLFALDLPAFALASAHRSVLAARGALHARAMGNVTRWSVRTVLSIAAALAGMGVQGIALTMVVTSFAELFVLRRYVRPSFRPHADVAPRSLLLDSLWFFAFSALLRLLERLDVVLLGRFGVAQDAVGWYAAAQSLAGAPALLTLFVSSLLLARIARDRIAGDADHALATAEGGLSLMFFLMPLLAVLAGGATVVVRVVFGARFMPAAPMYAWLTGAAWCFGVLWIGASVLSSYGRMRAAVWLAIALVLVAAVALTLTIPRAGPVAAAQVTTAVTALGALATFVLCAGIGVTVRTATIVRCVAVSVACFAAAQWAGVVFGGGTAHISWAALFALGGIVLAVPPMLMLLRQPNPVALIRLLSDSA